MCVTVRLLVPLLGPTGFVRILLLVLISGYALSLFTRLLIWSVSLKILLMVLVFWSNLLLLMLIFVRPGCPIFVVKVTPVVTVQAFLDFVGEHLHQEPFLELPILTGEKLYEAAMAKKTTAADLDGWTWNEIKALSPSWFVGLALVLRQIETVGQWPQGLLDAYIAMISKAEGDSTPIGQRPLCVLPVVYRLWASVRLAHLGEWFSSWVPDSVFSAGKGVSSVDAWHASSIDIEEVLSHARQSDFISSLLM